MNTLGTRQRAGGCQFKRFELEPLIGKDQVVWDLTLAGFGLRFFASGRRTWIVLTRIKGVLRSISLGGPPLVSETAARRKAQLLILEAKNYLDPLAAKRAALATPLFVDFAKAFRRYGVTRWKPSTIYTHDCYMRIHLLPAFGARFLDQIDGPSVFEWFSRLSLTRPGAANRALDILTAMFKRPRSGGSWRATPIHVLDSPRTPVVSFDVTSLRQSCSASVKP